MKRQWVAYLIVAVLAIGAGVAIAGLPNNVAVDATIVTPTDTEAPESSAPTTDVPSTTDTVIIDTTVADTAPPATTTAETTVAPTTEPIVTETTEAALPPNRADLLVAVANGAGIGGTAARNVARLADLGYENLTQHDGTEIVEFTVVYFADGFETAAAQLAEDLDMLPEFVAPLADAPAVSGLPDDTELLAYIGIDRAT